jgi:hypothetical protein
MSAFNQFNVQHSLRTYLTTTIGIPAFWIYDGVVLPVADDKPYLTVEQMQNNAVTRPKMREAVETIYRFQVGLRTKSASERARLQEEVEQSLDYARMPLLDASQSTFPKVGEMEADITAVVPISAASTEARSDYHRIYFDVEIRGYKYRK